jgi:hypothetical protein
MSVMVSVQTSLLIQGSNLHGVADAIMDHLVVLAEADGSQVLDSAVDADEVAGSLTIEVTVRAADMGSAVNVAMAAIRTAIHATGGSTEDWFTPEELRVLDHALGAKLQVNRLEPV